MPGDGQEATSLPVQSLKGVGDKLAGHLLRLGVERTSDLLFHLPSRYEDRTKVTPIGALQPFSSAQIEGEVLAADLVFGRRRSLMVKIGDSTGLISLRFFHFSKTQQQGFRRGRRIRCYGDVRPGRSGLEIYHPEYQFLDQDSPLEKRLTPIYPGTEGLTQKRLRNLTDQALALLQKSELPDLLAGFEIQGHKWPLSDALLYLHRPPENANLQELLHGSHPAQQRLIIEELVAHQIGMLKARRQTKDFSAPVITMDEKVELRILKQFGFKPTPAQLRVSREITADMQQPHPMMRLLQGDVGSGKTLVAALAAAQVAAQGMQVALMVPTEILAEQHASNFQKLLEEGLNIKTLLLTGRHKGKARQALLDLIQRGDAKIVIGTHALFQEDISFRDLALIIIDEQHRFGVNQRLALQDKARNEKHVRPHQLVMTATPIPRTLAMSHYAHLDLSVIDQLPPGRKPVNTALISQDRRTEVIERVRSFCSDGRQVYWVCTLIEEGEMENLKAAEITAEELALAFPDLSIGLIHGRLKSSLKDQIMRDFKAGEIDVLVATTVIEVGVDVPNASLMVIENPERLGLSQLHQLRGRVGRGQQSSHCLLLYGTPLSKSGKQRLEAMRRTADGFELAEIDLQLRGAGELLGVRQAGDATYHLVELSRDSALLVPAREIAEQLIGTDDPRANSLMRRWLSGRVEYSFS